MCTYLAKCGSIYYFRRAFPAELRSFLDGKAEWMISLHTKDREEAKQRIPAHTMATDQMAKEARAKLTAIYDEAERPPHSDERTSRRCD